MKLIKFYIIIITLISVLNANDVNTGIINDYTLSTKKEAQVAIRLIEKYLNEAGFEIHLKFYDKSENIINDYINNKLKTVIIDYASYFQNKKTIDKLSRKRWFTPMNKDNIYAQYYFIKNKNLKLNFKNMGESQIVFMGQNAKNWFESFLMKENSISLKDISENVIDNLKVTNVVSKVFFNKNYAAIISKSYYDVAITLNPSLKKQIEIVKMSKPIFMPYIAFTRKNSQKSFDEIVDYLGRKGFYVNPAYSVSKPIIPRDEELEELNSFYSEYFTLKKKYK